jgi:hypothetical protein
MYVLHGAASAMEAGAHMLSSLLDENEAPEVSVRHGDLSRCLDEKEVRILQARVEVVRKAAKEVRIVARHLWKTTT